MKISIVLEALTGSFETDIKRANRAADKAFKDMERQAKVAAQAVGAAAAAGVTALALLTRQSIKTADELAKMSQKVGVSVESLSTLGYAAERSGVGLDGLRSGLVKLAKNAGDAAIGIGEARKGFDALGISVTDAEGKLKNNDVLLRELADKFASFEDGAQKTALAVNIFGRSGADLIPMLNAGADGIGKMEERARALGLEMDTNTAKSAEQFNDLMDDAGDLVRGFANDVAKELLPKLTSAADLFVGAGIKGRDGATGVELLSTAIRGVILGSILVKNGLEATVETIAGLIDVLHDVGEAYIDLVGNMTPAYQLWTRFNGTHRDSAEVIEELRTSVERTRQTVAGGWANAASDMADAFEALEGGAKKLSEALTGNGNGNGGGKPTAPSLIDTERAAREAEKALAKTEKAMADAAKEADRLAAAVLKNARFVEDLEDELSGPLAQAYRKHERAAEDLRQAYLKGEVSLADYGKGLDLLKEKRDREIDAITEQGDVLGRFNAQAAQDAALIGLEGRQLAVAQAVQRVTAEYIELERRGTPMVDSLEQVQAGVAATEGALYDMAEAAEYVNRIADDVARGFEDFAFSVLDDVSSVDDAWSALGDSLADTAKRAVAQMLSEFLRLQVIKPLLQGIFGGGFNAGSLFSGGGAGLNFGSLLGGAGGQGGGLLGSIVGGVGSFFGFGGGAAAGTATGVTGTAAAAGFTGGTNAAAASSGGLFGGGGGGFAGVPVVGWILAGMALSNSLFGQGWASNGGSTTLPNGATVRGGGSAQGRILDTLGIISNPLVGLLGERAQAIFSGSPAINFLFGRKAPVLTNGETTFGVGPDGVFGSERYRTYERGGVFRSSRRRWHDFGLSEESTEYAQGLFEFVDSVMDDAAQRLATEAPDNFRAALRVVSEYNKDGTIKASQFFVDMFGQAFEVASEEEALQRIGAEAIIATIDGFMSNATEAVSEAVQDFGGSAGTGLGEIILRDLKTAEQTQGEAHAIAERWRHDTTLLAEGAAFLLDAASDINAGFALLGDDSSLTDIADLTEELQRSGEPLLETYQRMVAATRLLDDALELSGVTMDKTREEIVRFATGVAEAAGGIERATALWSSYFETFYSESERAALALSRGRDNAITQFADIGLDLDDFTGQDGTQAFRDLFESALPTLSEEAVVEWLEAADALGIVIELTEQYAGLLGTQADTLDFFMAGVRAQAEEFAPPATFEERLSAVNDETDKLIQRAIELGASEKDIAEIRALGQRRLNVILEEQQEAIAAAEEALRQQEQAAADLAETLTILEAQSAGGVTPLTQSLMDLRAEYESTIETINDLARASGRASASEAELAIARNWYNNQVQRLIDELFASAASLVQQFYGTTAGGLASGGGISPVASADLGGIGQVVDAVEDRYALELRLLQQLQQFIDGLTLSSLSPLTPDQRLNEAQAQYEALLAAAQGGDLDALAQLQGAAQAYLGEAQSYYGGVGAYPDIFASVLEQLGLLTGAGPQSSPASNPPQPVFGGPVTVEPGPGFAELSALDRELIATELVDVLRDIVGISQQSLVEISAQLGLDLQDLVEALGVNLQDLTVSTTLQLADISRNLGVDLVELADGVGFALGDLADEQSLLNDALEQVIGGLPDDIRGRLNQLLRNIELATTEADANEAIEEAEDAINALPADIRDLLAPFFTGVNSPTDNLLQQAYQQTSALNLIESHAGQTVLELQALKEILNNPPPEPASPTATVPISAAVTAAAPLASGGEVVQLRELAALRKAMEDTAATNRQLLNEARKPNPNGRRAA